MYILSNPDHALRFQSSCSSFSWCPV